MKPSPRTSVSFSKGMIFPFIKRWIVLAVTILFQFLYLLTFFLDENLSWIKSCLSKPFYEGDHAELFENAQAVSYFLREEGLFWGYHPKFLAGMPWGIYLGVDNHPAQVLMALFGNPAWDAIIFNGVVIFAYFLIPLLIYKTFKNFGYLPLKSQFMSLTAIIVFMGSGYARDIQDWGLYCYTLSVIFSFFAASYSYRLSLEKSEGPSFGWLLFLGPLLLFFHPLSPMLAAIFCVPVLILVKERSLSFYGKIAVVFGLTFLLNLSWITPYFYSLPIHSTWAHADQTSLNFIVNHLHEIYPDHLYFLFMLILSGALFIAALDKNNFTFVKKYLLILITIFFPMAYFGTQIGLEEAQPLRFLFPLQLMIAFFSVSLFLETKTKMKKAILGICLLIFPLSFVRSSPEKTCGAESNPSLKKIIDFFNRETRHGDRIMINDSIFKPYYRGHFTAVIPRLTGREVLNGSFSHTPTTFQFVHWNKKEPLFGVGNHYTDISREELEYFLEVYNVRYILVYQWHKTEALMNYGIFDIVLEADGWYHMGFEEDMYFTVLEYKNYENSLCVEKDCYAKIDSFLNGFKIIDPPAGKFTLKYHYHPNLEVLEPGVSIFPVKIKNDPNPFIGIDNPQDLGRINIRFHYNPVKYNKYMDQYQGND